MGIGSRNSRIKENLVSDRCVDMSREPLLEPNKKVLGFLKAWGCLKFWVKQRRPMERSQTNV